MFLKLRKFCLLFIFLNLLCPISHSSIDINDIAGLYDSFQDEYKHLSPLYGLLLRKSGVLSNIRTRGNYGPKNPAYFCHKQITNPAPGITSTDDKDCPQDHTTALIQHIFPSPIGGELAISRASSDFFYGVSIEQIGGLLELYTKFKSSPYLEKNLSTRIRSVIKKLNADSIRDGWSHLPGPNKLHTLSEMLAKMFVGARDEGQNYPFAVVEAALMALAIEKAEDVKALDPLLKRLKDFRKNIAVNKKFAPQMYADFKRQLVNNRLNEKNRTEILSDDELLIYYTLAAEIRENFPPLVGKGSSEYKGVSFQDCVEIGLLNFFNIALSQPKDKIFDVDLLSSAFPNSSSLLIDFFRHPKYRAWEITDVSIGSSDFPEYRREWAKVVSDLNKQSMLPKVKYVTPSSSGGYCAIESTLDSTLAVFELILKDKQFEEIKSESKSDEERRRKMLDLIFSRFSRHDYVLTWRLENEIALSPHNYENIIISVNGEEEFIWRVGLGDSVMTKWAKEEQNGWRKTNIEIFDNLLQRNSPIKGALLPYYLDQKLLPGLISIPHIASALPRPELLYGSILQETSQKMMALSAGAMLGNKHVLDLASKWIKDAGPDDSYKSAAVFFYNLQNLKGGSLSGVEFSNLGQAYEETLKNIDDNCEILWEFFSVPYSEYFITHIIDEIASDSEEEYLTTRTKNLTLLDKAAETGYVNLVNLLLKKMPSLVTNLKIAKSFARNNKGGRTALHVAAQNGKTEVIKVLLEMAPQLANNQSYVYDADRNSPLHLAAEKGHLNSVKLLISAAPQLLSEPFVRNSKEKTALELLDKYKHHEVMELLASTFIRLK